MELLAEVVCKGLVHSGGRDALSVRTMGNRAASTYTRNYRRDRLHNISLHKETLVAASPSFLKKQVLGRA